VNNLGYIYENGFRGIKKDIKEAINLYYKAASYGNSSAFGNLAIIYFYGKEGIEKNEKKAIDFFNLSIKLGNTRSSKIFIFIFNI
jgi:TPR repeat protein